MGSRYVDLSASPPYYNLSFTIGLDHQRQRKIMTPAFHAPQLKTFLPLFLNVALKVGHPRWLGHTVHVLKKLSAALHS